MELQKIPIFRMYRLITNEKDRDDFVAEGVNNLLTSHQNEAGTLAMYATHADKSGTINYIFEMYQDQAHYQIHAESPQFKHFAKVAQKIVTGRDVTELQPESLLSGNKGFSVSGENPYLARLVEFSTDSANKSKIKTELSKLNSQITSYKATIKDQPNQFVLFDIYKNQNDLNESLDQLKKILIGVSDLEIKTLKVDTMVSQKNINLN
ncbi:putative quinol monooxygenase [Companilactobacillus halodurans]|uniref:ABM domain-containing protein n=1 Tax=Companilactobacillus halodurans TaxID=2584183 RepID=A0A5P0ZLU9_9LACO|nr:antibiotic biosynthesis monooxygenase [Companilactobacillus halodurans]MQS75187.1 hypothetical protein [Companilactobacillus halodurans]MQS97548.1 hypothetical protein [Companilactobacillus halodurans]